MRAWLHGLAWRLFCATKPRANYRILPGPLHQRYWRIRWPVTTVSEVREDQRRTYHYNWGPSRETIEATTGTGVVTKDVMVSAAPLDWEWP